MFNKSKTIIITIILILSGLILSLNSGVGTENIENGLHETSIARTLPRSNGEINWSQIEVLSEPVIGQDFNTGWSSDSSIAVENGNIYVVWHDDNDTNGAGTDTDIFYRYFNGNFWSAIQIISEPIMGNNINVDNSGSSAIAVENGNIYVVWTDETNTNGASGDWDIFFRCNLTGSGWEDIQVISEPAPGQNYNTGNSLQPDIAVESGNIYVVWDDSNNTNGAGAVDKDIFFRCNLTGSGWEDIQVISEPVPGQNFNTGGSLYPSIAVESGNIYVVWHDDNETNGEGTDYDIFYRRNLTGSGWNPIQVLSEPVPGQNFNTSDSLRSDIAVENDKVYVVWRDYNNTKGAGTDDDIFYRYFDGTSWTDIQVISEPILGKNFNTLGSASPKIAVENSNIYVVWSDLNNTNDAGTDWDIFYRCNITGLGWGPINVISEPVPGQDFNTGGSSWPEIAVENYEIHITWQDTNNTNGAGTDIDILYRKSSSLCLLFPKVTPTSGDTSTYFNFTVTYSHIENISPTKIILNISGTEYPLLEVDPLDLNYMDGKDYFLNITHLDIGIHKYQFSTSDGKTNRFTSFIYKPVVYNTAPNITIEDNLTALEDEYYEVLYLYEDIDLTNVGQLGTWNYSTNASWLEFDDAAAILNGTPMNNNVGKYWVNISINDTMDMDFTNFTLTVLNVNDNPMINTTNVEITYEDELYEVDYNASDIDSLISNQIWSLDTNASSWLDIDPSIGIINGTPNNNDVGEYWINVSVDDGDGGNGFTNFTLIVLNVNDPPVITTQDVLFTNESELYQVDYNATDVDSLISQQTWSLDTNATWLSIDSSTGVLSGTPVFKDLFVDENIMVAGWYVNVSVTDGDGGSDSHEFILVVWKSQVIDNEPPEITTIDKVSITASTSYNIIYEATDDRTPISSLIWSYNSNASWLSFNKINRALSGNPTLSHVGWYWVNLTVNDGEGGFDSHNFTLTVWAAANQPPDILTKDDVNAVVGELYLVDYEAEDDRTPLDKLQWSLETNASDWLDIDPETGVLSGTPELKDVSSYWVKVSVFDGEDGWDFTNFTLWVTTEAITTFPPKLSNPSMTPSTGDTKTEFTFSVDYSHPEGDLPDSIQVVIDDIAYDLKYNASSDSYEYRMKLYEGELTYYFTATLGEYTILTEVTSIIVRRAPHIQPEDGNGKDGDEDNTMLYAGIGIIVIIIIVVLILLFIFLKKKKGKEEEPPVEEAQPPPPEEVPPEVPPEQPPTTEIPPEQPPTPEVTPEQVPVPETPTQQPQLPEVPPEQPSTPEVTPQVPQVEPAPEPAPMPQVEEQPVPQVEQQPQVGVQEPAVEQPAEQQQPPVPRVKEPTIKVPEEDAEK